MKRRNFIGTAGLLGLVPAIKGIAAPSLTVKTGKEIYEWRIYTLNEGKAVAFDAFMGGTLIPAYNRLQITVGAFAPYKPSDKTQRFYLFKHPDLTAYHEAKASIWQDKVFREAAQPFYDETAVSPAYSVYDLYLCEAFDRVPRLIAPSDKHTVFEFRNYRSPNEEANQRKIDMFNVDEIPVFDATGISSVCYGEVLSGPRMPSLIYLTSYDNEPARDAAWGRFSAHPDWARIRSLPQYAHTATDNVNVLLSPLPYSGL
ncbi:MAG: NIPSNAP family protein [Tannerellaceae bacterium]|jgi:hypothetical protein|nr:NIPSNAP family protein [Tannerellaceae bacterium]